MMRVSSGHLWCAEGRLEVGWEGGERIGRMGRSEGRGEGLRG